VPLAGVLAHLPQALHRPMARTALHMRMRMHMHIHAQALSCTCTQTDATETLHMGTHRVHTHARRSMCVHAPCARTIDTRTHHMYTHHAVLTCDAQVHAYETHMPCTHTLPCSRAYREWALCSFEPDAGFPCIVYSLVRIYIGSRARHAALAAGRRPRAGWRHNARRCIVTGGSGRL
jgi:hypothetical protein